MSSCSRSRLGLFLLALVGVAAAVAAGCRGQPGRRVLDPITGAPIAMKRAIPVVVVGKMMAPFEKTTERGEVEVALQRGPAKGITFADTYGKPGAKCGPFLCPLPLIGRLLPRTPSGQERAGHQIYIPALRSCGCLALDHRSAVLDFAPVRRQ